METQADQVDEIVVTGIRASLANSVAAKREADQIVDVITAEDIGQLPDANVADALQRVTGVQISRTFGEGSRINIRGLQNVRIEIDGRANLSTALETSLGDSAGRNSGLEQLSSALFSRLEVFKTPTAGQIEGGLGGVVNARTAKPFDFTEPTFAYSVEASYGDIAESLGYSGTALVTGRFLDDRLGALLSLSYQDRPLGAQYITRAVWGNRTTDLSGDGMVDLSANNLRGEFYEVDRQRAGLSGNLTYRPSDSVELFLDVTAADLTTDRDTLVVQLPIGNSAVTNPVFSGNYLVAGTVNQPLTIGGIQRDEPSDLLTVASGGSWTGAGVKVSGEVAYTRAGYELEQTAYLVRTSQNVAGTFDYRTGDVPNLTVVTTQDLNNPANFAHATLLRTRTDRVNDEISGRIDAIWDLSAGPFTAFKAGARYSELQSTNLGFSTTAAGVAAPGTLPSNFFGTQDWELFSGLSGSFPENFIRPRPLAGGASSPLLTASSSPVAVPLEYWDIEENVWAGYLEADLESVLFGLDYRANIGVRIVDTSIEVATNQAATIAGVTTVRAVQDDSGYTDWLPSANIAFDLSDDLVFRLSAARVMARQSFQDLAPATAIRSTPPSATGGNAALEPARVNQYDASLEWYFAPASILSGAVFFKDATGFTVRQDRIVVVPGYENLGPIPFSQPFNSGTAEIKGFELGYSQTFDFLPGFWSGFGVIANYTYADGETGTGDPIVGLSENSFNLTGFYESGGFNARLAYNWRDERLFSFTVGTTRRPNFVSAAGTLDASVSYDFNDRFSVYLNATNLLPEESATTNFNVNEQAINAFDIYETTVLVGLRGKF